MCKSGERAGVSTTSKHNSEIRTAILAGNHDYAVRALRGEFPLFTAIVATVACVLYHWTDQEIVDELEACSLVDADSAVFHRPFSMFPIAALDILGIRPYEGDDALQLQMIHDKLSYFSKNEILG